MRDIAVELRVFGLHFLPATIELLRLADGEFKQILEVPTSPSNNDIEAFTDLPDKEMAHALCEGALPNNAVG